MTDSFTLQSTRTREDEEKRLTFSRTASETSALNLTVADITCYRGKEKEPLWMDLEPGTLLI